MSRHQKGEFSNLFQSVKSQYLQTNWHFDSLDTCHVKSSYFRSAVATPAQYTQMNLLKEAIGGSKKKDVALVKEKLEELWAIFHHNNNCADYIFWYIPELLRDWKSRLWIKIDWEKLSWNIQIFEYLCLTFCPRYLQYILAQDEGYMQSMTLLELLHS